MKDKIDVNQMKQDFASMSTDLQQSIQDLKDFTKVFSTKVNNATKGRETTTRDVLANFSTSDLKREIRARQMDRRKNPGVNKSKQNKRRKK